MTPAQQLRARGFDVHLAQRGVTLRLLPGGSEFRAVVSRASEAGGQYRLNPEDSAGDTVHIRRNHAGLDQIHVRSSLRDDENGVTYQVRDIANSPADIAVRFEVETLVDHSSTLEATASDGVAVGESWEAEL